MIDLRTLDRLARVDPSRLNDEQLLRHMRQLLTIHAELIELVREHLPGVGAQTHRDRKSSIGG